MSAVEEPNQERRITFCLYECWEKLAGGTGLPALKDMNRADIEPYSKNLVLLDLRNGNENPTFQVIGEDLQDDLDSDLTSHPVKEVPRRTMLSRVTDHYMEVLANRVPIAFEAEFVNRDNEKALYRGILLPFSDDDNNINFILGGVRWILAKDLHLEDGKPTIEELMRNIADRNEDEPEQVSAEEAVQEPDAVQEEIVSDEVAQEDVIAEEDIASEETLSEQSGDENIIQDEIIADDPYINEPASEDDEPQEEAEEVGLVEEEEIEPDTTQEEVAGDEEYIEVTEEPSLADDIIDELTEESPDSEEETDEPVAEEAIKENEEDIGLSEDDTSPPSEESDDHDGNASLETEEGSETFAKAVEEELAEESSETDVEAKKEKKKNSVIENAMKFLSPRFRHDEEDEPEDVAETEAESEDEPVNIIEDDVTEPEGVPPSEAEQEIAASSEDPEVEPEPQTEEIAETEMDDDIGEVEEIDVVEIEAEEIEIVEIEVEEIEVEEIEVEEIEVEEIEVEEIVEDEEDDDEEQDVAQIDDKEQSLPQLRITLDQITGYINKEDANHNRSRDSLYNILTAIYEFHETCEHSPEAFKEIVKEQGLKIQARAPFTPVLKVCLGKDYDKTRLTEYAAALGIAQHMNIDVSEFHNFIKNFPGGIKGCVKEMRRIRKHGAAGKVIQRKTRTIEDAREILHKLEPISSFRLKKAVVGKNIDEFCLLLARREGHKIDVLKILDDKYTKIDPILKRSAFIKGNLNNRK